MNRWWKGNPAKYGGAVLGLLAITLLLFSVNQNSNAASGMNEGAVAPDFTLTDFDGNQVSLSDFRGEIVFINFWATWCPPCRAEMPEMEAVYQEYKDKEVVIIGVDIQEPVETVRQFVQEGGYSWTFLLDVSGIVTADYEVVAIPSSFFLDKEGKIRAVNVGAMTKGTMEANLSEAMR